MQNFIKHRTDNSWLVRNALRHLRITVHVLWRSLVDKIPGASTTERSDILHELNVEGEQIAVDLLRGEMELPNFKAETIGTLLVEHENILRTLKTAKASPSITTIARTVDKAIDIEREALQTNGSRAPKQRNCASPSISCSSIWKIAYNASYETHERP